MLTIESIDDIVVNGGIVVTSDGAGIGSVEQIFLSEGTGEPAFVTVRTGLLGMSESFVPLAGASIDGSRIRVAFERHRIKNGPWIDSDRGAITSDEEDELYLYYGLDVGEATTDVAETGAAVVPPPHPHLVKHLAEGQPPRHTPPPPHLRGR